MRDKPGLCEKLLGGHMRIGPITLFGFNAMHIAVDIRVRKWGQYICFHPPFKCFGRWWPWYFYVSPNATPWAAIFAIGPGLSRDDKIKAKIRRKGMREYWATREAIDRLKDEEWVQNSY